VRGKIEVEFDQLNEFARKRSAKQLSARFDYDNENRKNIIEQENETFNIAVQLS